MPYPRFTWPQVGTVDLDKITIEDADSTRESAIAFMRLCMDYTDASVSAPRNDLAALLFVDAVILRHLVATLDKIRKQHGRSRRKEYPQGTRELLRCIRSVCLWIYGMVADNTEEQFDRKTTEFWKWCIMSELVRVHNVMPIPVLVRRARGWFDEYLANVELSEPLTPGPVFSFPIPI